MAGPNVAFEERYFIHVGLRTFIGIHVGRVGEYWPEGRKSDAPKESSNTFIAPSLFYLIIDKIPNSSECPKRYYDTLCIDEALACTLLLIVSMGWQAYLAMTEARGELMVVATIVRL